MSYPGTYGSQGRDLQARTKRILDNHLEHDLTEADRAALEHANQRLTYWGLGGALLGPLAGVSVANTFLLRRIRARQAGQPLPPGVRPRYPPGGFLIALGVGLLAGFLATDVALLYGFKQASDIIDREGDPVRISKAMRAASAEVLRAQAMALEGNTVEVPSATPVAAPAPKQERI